MEDAKKICPQKMPPDSNLVNNVPFSGSNGRFRPLEGHLRKDRANRGPTGSLEQR